MKTYKDGDWAIIGRFGRRQHRLAHLWAMSNPFEGFGRCGAVGTLYDPDREPRPLPKCARCVRLTPKEQP